MIIELAPNNPYGLALRTPVVAAAGCLGYGVEYARMLGLRNRGGSHGLGALVTRTTTLRPQRATPLPRIVETPAGLLYSGGAHNPGLRFVLERHAPAWANWELPVILSIAGDNAAECAEAARLLEGIEGIAGVEVHLGAMEALLPTPASQVVAAVRAATLLPLLAKIPPHAPDPVALAQAAAGAGADTIVVSGGMPGMAIDPATGEEVRGMLCGPALRPLALGLVAAVAQAVAAPVVGGGGIVGADDARQFLAAGAGAVSMGAALLADPWATQRVANDLATNKEA